MSLPQSFLASSAFGLGLTKPRSFSSNRGELRKGQEIDRYIEVDGLWYLADGIEAEGNGLKGQPSASDVNNDNGGKSNAAALD